MECTEWKNDPAASAPLIPGDPQNLIYSTGEMADLTRAFNWSETPVARSNNGQILCSSPSTRCLASRFPMFLVVGRRAHPVL